MRASNADRARSVRSRQSIREIGREFQMTLQSPGDRHPFASRSFNFTDGRGERESRESKRELPNDRRSRPALCSDETTGSHRTPADASDPDGHERLLRHLIRLHGLFS